MNVGSGGPLGDILVDGDGLALYIFDNDTEGVSNCSGGCLVAWPPLLTADQPVTGAGVEANIGSITLADGTMQVTVNGFPAYYWQNDVDPGDTLGNARGGVWWVFNPDGTPQRPAKVGLREHSTLGEILVDGDGLSLYIFDNDTEGVSNCSGGCLTAWPPLLTEYPPVALNNVTAEIGSIALADGTMQVTVNGFPAYYWQNDTASGEALGQAVNGVWWVFNPDGTPQRPAKVGLREHSTLGEILVDGDGLSLYIFDNDTEGVSNCSGGCLTAWPPLLTEYPPAALNGVTAEIGSITLADGTMQVTVNGFPAYYWQNDVDPGDTLGNARGGVWWVFNPDGTPQRPAKVGLREHSALGEILVDGDGLSLYIFDNDTEGVSNCSGGCLVAWPPLLTEYPPVALNGVTGTIGTISRSDGSKQVTINNLPVYYWQNDTAPGEALGHAVNGVWWVLDATGNSIRN